MQKLWELARHYWQALVLAVAAVTTALTINSLVDWIRSNLAKDLEQGDGQMLLSPTWGWAVALTVIVCAASLLSSFILLVEFVSLKRESEQVIARKMDLCSKTLNGMMLAATKITNRMYPPAANPPFSIEAIQITTTVREDGSSTVKAEYRIKAHGNSPVHFWEISIGAETVAPSVAFLDEIDFKIKDKQGADRVAYLVTKNSSHNKGMSVYFLPHLMPGEPAREIVYTYEWPQMVKRLLDQGDEEFGLEVRSRTAVAKIDYAMYFHPKLWRTRSLSCQLVSSAVGTGSLTEEDSQDLGWHGWRYTVQNAPAQGFAYRLLFQAPKR